MSDYTPTTNFSEKDSLPIDDPEKLILGADLDVEFDALNVSIATKYDSSDIATQAQAEAGLSNEVLMTPLRTAQYLGAGAGVLGDIADLTDPNADRILFWDDSAGAATWLTVGSGLDITDTTLTVDEATTDHDTLLNFVANEHIDHSAVTLTLTEGLQWSSGGADLTASATAKLDINGLTEETTLDLDLDFGVFYDASAATHRKADLRTLVGSDLGDGRWYRTGTQAISAATETTVVYNTAAADNLEQGSFSLVTGKYTAGANGARVLVSAIVTIQALNSGAEYGLKIKAAGATIARVFDTNQADSNAKEIALCVTTICTLTSAQTVEVLIETSTAETVETGAAFTTLSVVELA